jgi:hypothetical protein
MLGAFLQAAVVVCACKGRVFWRYFTLNLYMLVAALLTIGRFIIFWNYGFLSLEYRYFYFYSDAILTICLYFALMGLYSHVFQEMGVHRYLRAGALLLLALTCGFTYKVLANSSANLVNKFVVELSQNLYFVGLVLTYLLWGAVMKLRETRTQIIQLVSALGVYFSAFAGSYAFHNLSAGHINVVLWTYLPQLLALWLPLAWAYTFAKIPQEARLATARVATTQGNSR